MRRARALLGSLAIGALVCLGAQTSWALNTQMVGFGLANAYQPGSCSFCHGNSGVGTVGQYWPAGAPGSYPNRAADHPQHIAALSLSRYQETAAVLVTDTGKGTAHDKQVALCLACHPNPGQPRAGTGEASHAVNADPAGIADVHGDGRTPSTASTFQTIRKQDDPSLAGVVQVVQGIYSNSAAANGKRCSTVDCHYRVPTPVTGATPDGWYNAAALATCSNCHGSGTAGASLPNVHQAHVGSKSSTTGPAGREYACTQCHPTHVDMAHQNGAVDLAFGAALGEPGDIPATQTDSDLLVKFGAEGGGSAYARCENFYCHGADMENGGTNHAPEPDRTTPTWNDYTTGNCGTCHGINGNPAASRPQSRSAYLAVVSGSHIVHLAEARGPSLEVFGTGRQFAHSANGCYQCHNSVIPANHAAACADCHYPTVSGQSNTAFGAIGPGASRPTSTHVDGRVDFGNTVQSAATQSLLGATAPAGAPDTTSTDRCNQCHSTTPITGVGVGTVLAKANWADSGYELPCLTCHNAADQATRNADGSGVLAPAKDTHYATRGHGLSSGASYAWVPNRGGAGAACSDCHDSASAHISGTLGDGDRLVTVGNALCDSCHDGTGTGNKAQTRVSTHGNRSTTMSYSAKRSAFELNCVECHDVHGSANAYMVNTGNADGPLVPVRYYGGAENLTSFLFGGAVSFTANNPGGPDYAAQASGDTSKICQTCHTQTAFYRRTLGAGGHPNTDCIMCHKHAYDEDFGPGSQDGFMPAGCNGCHGYPPIRPADVARLDLPGVNNCTDLAASSSDYQCENYVSGGGFHWAHVEALKKRFPASTDARELCGPCHGDGAGSADHNGSNNGPGNWPISARGFVNIREKASGQSSWGAGTYNGASVTVAGTTPPASAMTEANSRCAALDCHGRPAAGENLNWFTPITDGAGPSDALAKSQACKGCHDQTPAQWRVYNAGGSLVYTGNAPDAATVYYGTLSGYSRGGHGDIKIRDEDPFINSAPSHTVPIDCTACHSNAADHFPSAAGDLNRLGGVAIQTNTGGLCNDCHPVVDYPGNHHPSFYGSTKGNPANHNIVAATGQEIYTDPSTWTDQGGGHYEQNGYRALNWTTDVDGFVNWWGGNYGNANQDPPPRPVFYGEATSAPPKASLPLARYIGNQVNTDQLMCTTCHNPHGTDLYTYDPLGGHQQVPDNNMLRLRDADNTLCNACH